MNFLDERGQKIIFTLVTKNVFSVKNFSKMLVLVTRFIQIILYTTFNAYTAYTDYQISI